MGIALQTQAFCWGRDCGNLDVDAMLNMIEQGETELRTALAAANARAEAAEAKLAAVPWDALYWIDRSYTGNFWSSIEGPPAYAALHAWLEQQDHTR